MRAIIVLELDIPAPEDLPIVLQHLDPPTVPYFAGTLRVAIDPVATTVLTYLDE